MASFKLPDELAFIENRRARQKTTTASLTGKLCVVSGSTSGVGLAAVRRLARAGAHIVMLVRNPGKAAAVQRELLAHTHAPVEVILADFSDLASVRAAAEVLHRNYPRIDVLIN